MWTCFNNLHFSDKKTSNTNKLTGTDSENKEKLVEKLHNAITRKIENIKQKVHSSFIDNIWHGDLVDMKLLIKFKKGIIFCVLMIFILNILGLFLSKIKKVLQLLIFFKKTD